MIDGSCEKGDAGRPAMRIDRRLIKTDLLGCSSGYSPVVGIEALMIGDGAVSVK